MDQKALNDILDKKWDAILEALPDSSLQKLLALPDSEVNDEKVYQIITESGIDLETILLRKEAHA